jgi:hypothetical protein
MPNTLLQYTQHLWSGVMQAAPASDLLRRSAMIDQLVSPTYYTHYTNFNIMYRGRASPSKIFLHNETEDSSAYPAYTLRPAFRLTLGTLPPLAWGKPRSIRLTGTICSACIGGLESE